MKPREFWITESRCTGKQKAHKTQLECWGEIQHNDNEYHVIEYAFYEKLKAELAESEAKYNFMVDSAQQNARERDALKDNLAECYADFKEIARVLADANRAIDELEAERDREREAAKVMREALCSIEGGDARDEKEAGEIARTAIAKADEIRGKK